MSGLSSGQRKARIRFNVESKVLKSVISDRAEKSVDHKKRPFILRQSFYIVAFT